jgi:redox-sensitive bicupin YhaK (pirin superfamily)
MTDKPRDVVQIVTPAPVTEGAGVHLLRVFPGQALDYPDPFLLLDHFGSDDPADYLAGFPMHPHRGIETVTYMLEGAARHTDSMGNSGVIEPGDVQWMTAGRAILHEEMPEPRDGMMEGFQLWVNLPAALKMMDPRSQEIAAEMIPVVYLGNDVTVRVIAGAADAITGPVRDIAVQPTYLDVTLAPGGRFEQATPRGHTVMAYAFRGAGSAGGAEGGARPLTAPRLALFGDGDRVTLVAGAEGLRFLFIAGLPLNEPIVRYGPFVMNTRQEILDTLAELRDGTFIR